MGTHQPGQAGVITNRSITGVGTTDTSVEVTAPVGSFRADDVGLVITGTGIAADTTVDAVEADGSGATLSAAATATGTVTVALGGGTGFMQFAGEYRHRTNDTAITGIGTEGPSAIPGGTIADGRVRATVDTRNAEYVGEPDEADPEAPREWE
jgi:hypothetical protein